jgi:hypothetical protein
VTGSYESKSDCSISWKLQDTSGAFQNFSGTLSADAASVQFRQTDPGGAQRGIMKKTSDACSAASLMKTYTFTVSGRTTPMQPDEVSHIVSGKGTLDTGNGSFQVDSDCSCGSCGYSRLKMGRWPNLRQSEHAWLSRRRRQEILPSDRPRRNGGRTLHF